MYDSQIMQMLYCCKDVLDDPCCVSLYKLLLINDSIEQFSSGTVFCDKVEILRILIGFNQSNYVGMVNLPQDADLLFDHDNLIITDLIPMKTFDRIPRLWIRDF